MKGNLAVAFPKKLTETVVKLQKELGLKSPGEVILKALSLLELSMGRKVQLKDDKETLEIKSLQGLKQSVKVEELPDKEN
ncbi:hypothetical protein JW766_00140 [Candidatus Dojkabacteria bacterium]|nr:hypothetical protein [Candidatus Dojkabacteria bacterium]